MPITKLNNQSISAVTSLPSTLALNNWKLVGSQTASSVASVEFTNATYSFSNYIGLKSYILNIDVSNNATALSCELDFGAGYVTSNYNYIFQYDYGNNTSNNIQAGNSETNANFLLTPNGFGNSTGHTGLIETTWNDMSNTSLWKYAQSEASGRNDDGNLNNKTMASYESTSAVTKIKFKISAGTFSGNILIFGIKA
jgi:hypothetical protein